MTFPTNILVPVVVAVVGLTGLVLGWFINGLGFLAKRKLAGTPKTERAAYLNTVTDLATKMHANGMTIEEVHAFEAALRNPAVASSEAATSLVDSVDLDEGPRAFDANYAMKSRTRAAYDVADLRHPSTQHRLVQPNSLAAAPAVSPLLATRSTASRLNDSGSTRR